MDNSKYSDVDVAVADCIYARRCAEHRFVLKDCPRMNESYRPIAPYCGEFCDILITPIVSLKDNSMTLKISDVIREYATAMEQDCFETDTASVKYDLNIIADLLNYNGNMELNNYQAKDLRRTLGICEYGNAHWNDYCEERGCKDE